MDDLIRTEEQRVLDELDRAWNEAYLRNDRTLLGRILADEFVAFAADGRTITKAQLMQPGPAPRNIAFSERSILLYGPTAIARGRLTLEHDGGSVDQRFMRVYSKQQQRWQAVTVQVYSVQAESGAARNGSLCAMP